MLPLAPTLPLKSMGLRHVPLAARVLAYIRSLTRKTGQCLLMALGVEMRCPLLCRQLREKRTPCTHCEFFVFCRVGPGSFTPSPSQIPDVNLSIHPARVTARRLPPSAEPSGSSWYDPVGPSSTAMRSEE